MSRHFSVPTFTDLLKFRLILNVKDYASPIQEGKRKTISATLKVFRKILLFKKKNYKD